jgi:hypothetical protein
VLANEPICDWNGAWLTWEQMAKLNDDCPWSKHRCRHAGRTAKWPPVETAKHVMGWIVTWSERHPAAGRDAYQGSLFGFEAIAAYAADVGDLHKTVEADFTFGNNACHAITPQWGTRRYIGAYLADKAALLKGAARERMQEAAARYHDAHAAWVVFDEQLGQRFVQSTAASNRVAGPTRRAAGRAQPRSMRHWSMKRRRWPRFARRCRPSDRHVAARSCALGGPSPPQDPAA